MTSAGQFRPVSRDDFSRYAKALSWLIEEPLQKSQQLLARIYGYADVHELYAVLAKPGAPGPFGDDWLGVGHDGRLVVDPTIDRVGRGKRILELVTATKGLHSLAELSSRYWKSRDIGLFERPTRHREEYQRIRLLLEVLGADDVSNVARGANEYATLGTTITNANEYVLHFTPLGQAVFDAIRELRQHHRDNPSILAEKLSTLARQHPNNPWPLAASICVYGNQFDGDMTEGDATWIFENAKHAIALFATMYDGYEKQAPESALVTPNADCFYWPASLYWGGVAAAVLGKTTEAKRWLNLNMKICPRDEFGARFVLVEIAPTKTLEKRLLREWARSR